jgi:hypothetical protein
MHVDDATPEDTSKIHFQEGNDVAVQAELDEWANRMGYHKANETTLPRHRELRQDYLHLAEMVLRKVPASRERALALTALQESLMWANAGVAINLAPLALDQ